MESGYYRRGNGQSRARGSRSRGRSPGVRSRGHGGGSGGRGRSNSNSRSVSNSRANPNSRSTSNNRTEQRHYQQYQHHEHQQPHGRSAEIRRVHMWGSREDFQGGSSGRHERQERQERPGRPTSRNYNQSGGYGSSSAERRPRTEEIEFGGGRPRAPYASTNNAYGIIPPPEGMYPDDKGRQDDEFEFPQDYAHKSVPPVRASFPEGRDPRAPRDPRSFGVPTPSQVVPAVPNPQPPAPRPIPPSFGLPRQRSPSPPPPTPPPMSVIGPTGAIKNHVEVVCLAAGLQEFGEKIESDVRAQGYKVDLMFPKTDVKLSAFLNNIANSGTIFALVVRPDNPQHNSVSVHVLRPGPQEHRNMPLATAYSLMKLSYKNYRRHELGQVPDDVRASMKLILNDHCLTDMEYQNVIQFVQKRWLKQRTHDRRTDFDPGTGISTTEQLKQRIFNIMGVGSKAAPAAKLVRNPASASGRKVASAPRDPNKPKPPGTNPVKRRRPTTAEQPSTGMKRPESVRGAPDPTKRRPSSSSRPPTGPNQHGRSESSRRTNDPNQRHPSSSRPRDPNRHERPESSRKQQSSQSQEHRDRGESSRQLLRNPFQQQYQDPSSAQAGHNQGSMSQSSRTPGNPDRGRIF